MRERGRQTTIMLAVTAEAFVPNDHPLRRIKPQSVPYNPPRKVLPYALVDATGRPVRLVEVPNHL